MNTIESNTMTLEKAKLVVEYAEISSILLWESWHCYTDIDLDALEYLVNNSSRILLPNVKNLTDEQNDLLKTYKGYLVINKSI